MFYVIDRFTGEVLTDGPLTSSEVDRYLNFDLPTGYGWADVLVQADSDSRYNLTGDEWMGVA